MMNDWYCNILKILKKILNVVQVFEKKTDILVGLEVNGIEDML